MSHLATYFIVRLIFKIQHWYYLIVQSPVINVAFCTVSYHIADGAKFGEFGEWTQNFFIFHLLPYMYVWRYENLL